MVKSNLSFKEIAKITEKKGQTFCKDCPSSSKRYQITYLPTPITA